MKSNNISKYYISLENPEDYINAYRESLQYLGIFIPTKETFSRGDTIAVELLLPYGERLLLKAEVVFIFSNGIGVQFCGEDKTLSNILANKFEYCSSLFSEQSFPTLEKTPPNFSPSDEEGIFWEELTPTTAEYLQSRGSEFAESDDIIPPSYASLATVNLEEYLANENKNPFYEDDPFSDAFFSEEVLNRKTFTFREFVDEVCRIVENKITGVTELSSNSLSLFAYLYKGQVLAIEEIPPSEECLLGNIIQKEKGLSNEFLTQMVKEAVMNNVPLGLHLRRKGILTKKELETLLTKQMELRIDKIISWKEVSYHLKEGKLPKNILFGPPTSYLKLLFNSKKKKLNQFTPEELKNNLPQDKLFYFSPNSLELLHQLGLNQEEKQVITSIDRPFDFNTLFGLPFLSQKDKLVLFTTLLDFGILEQNWNASEKFNEFRKLLERKSSEISTTKNPYKILEISRETIELPLDEIYKDSLKKYSLPPSAPPDEWPKNLISLSREIISKIDRAYHQIKNFNREVLGINYTLSTANLIDILLEQGEMAVIRGDWERAIELYESVIEIDPIFEEKHDFFNKDKLIKKISRIKKIREVFIDMEGNKEK